MLRIGAKRFAGNVENVGLSMRIIVDPLGRKETPHGIFDKIRSGAYEMVLAVSHFLTITPFGMKP